MAESEPSLDQRSPGVRRPYLVVVAGLGIGRAFPVNERTQIGRDPEGDVVLQARTISWQHLIVSHREGLVTAEDLGSRNGTFVGLDKVKRRKLVEGDVLAVGESVLLKLVFATAPEGGGSTHSYLLPPEPMTGVETAAPLLDRLRKEQESVETDGAPLTLVWYRVDGLDEREELPLVEKAMRVVAVAILQAMKGERVVQEALYAFCSRSNRVARGDACAGRSAPCAECAPTLCPFAPVAVASRAQSVREKSTS